MSTFLRAFILTLCTGLSIAASAQKLSDDVTRALDLVQKNIAATGLTSTDLENSIVSDSYTSPDGITMVYLQQAYRSVTVYNTMQVMAFKDGKLLSLTGTRIPKIEQKVNQPEGVALISKEQAVLKAAAHLKAKTPTILIPSSGSDAYKKLTRYAAGDASQEDITVQALWTPQGDDRLKLTWQVFMVPMNGSDYWLVRVDALTGEVIEKSNLTVSCQWHTPANGDCAAHVTAADHKPAVLAASDRIVQSPALVNSTNYRVIPFPAESPIHPGGAHAIRTNPWTAAPGNATTLQWQSDGTTDYDVTRGNNVLAREDRLGTNLTTGLMDTSSTALPDLNFIQAPDYTLAPTVRANQKFGTTNLFYWNNIIHDITYLYGFTETAGNFQANNLSRGGAGNDYVLADAQDGAGTNNANFGTPSDGSRPRMQMYIFTAANPDRDGDVDNGIIVHEYGHGISNRFTGGPTNVSCLQNAEQGGEGWSDYFALMLTTNWATATVTDGAIPRGMGTYAINQTTTGGGIRNYPYTTNMAINPQTYASVAGAGNQVHNIGEIWCTMLWDMTWKLIGLDGINPDIYNPSGIGGNSVSLRLVSEGMRLQACSPGFVDARNAILRADTLLYGARYSCLIWDAFARRGLGVNASQGLSSSSTDGVAGYGSPVGVSGAPVNANKVQVQGNEQITYTMSVSTGVCEGISGGYITDTLPLNVSYLSGGTYNSANRVVTIPVTMAANATNNYNITARVNSNAYFAPVTHLNETVPTATLPSTFTATGTAPVWTVSTAQSYSTPNAFFAAEPGSVSDKLLSTATGYAISGSTFLSFRHNYNVESSYDGGVVEISVNGGTTWTDLDAYFVQNGYNGSISASDGSPIAGRRAFTGNSGGFILSRVNLSSFSGQTIRIRFRSTSDVSVAGSGWYLDDVLLQSEPYVINKLNLFASTNELKAATTIMTPIISGVLSIPQQPATVRTVRASLSDEINIYPNPVEDVVTIYLGDNIGIVQGQIMNASGQSVRSLRMQGRVNTINLSELRPGVYYVKIIGNEETVVKKIVKR